MTILDIAIVIFVLFETANVCILYFWPDSRRGNGVAVFNCWEKSKEDHNNRLFVSYLVNWVAGTKLIFIVLLIIVLFLGNEATKIGAVAVMILSIATYYWRLHPIIGKLDNKGEVTPKGYSKKLSLMVAGFMSMFVFAMIFYLSVQ